MKPIRWTDHAKKECARREVTISEAETTISKPDYVVPGQSSRQIFMRRYVDEVLQKEMLLRVVAEEAAAEIVVVTIYKTSKFKKYEVGRP